MDVWRENNPEDRKFTWRKKLGPGGTQMIRLDFFLVSDTLFEVIEGETILPGYRSDHTTITIKLCFDKNERGRGFWKFNDSLLKDPNFIQKVKDAILKVKRQYAPIPNNRDKIFKIERHDFQPNLNDQLFCLRCYLLK